MLSNSINISFQPKTPSFSAKTSPTLVMYWQTIMEMLNLKSKAVSFILLALKQFSERLYLSETILPMLSLLDPRFTKPDMLHAH